MATIKSAFMARILLTLALAGAGFKATGEEPRDVREWRGQLSDGTMELADLEGAIANASVGDYRDQLLELYVTIAPSEAFYPEYLASWERLEPVLSVEEADKVALYLVSALEGRNEWDTARATLDARLMESGGPETPWGFTLRYHSALLDYKLGDHEAAVSEWEYLYALGDDVIPEKQAGRIRRQLTDGYRLQERWEDTIRMGREARAFTSDDSRRILGLLNSLATAHEALREFDAAAEVIAELLDRVNHFFPDEASRRQGLGYTNVESWLARTQAAARAVADAEAAPLRIAFREGLDDVLKQGVQPGEDSGAPSPVLAELPAIEESVRPQNAGQIRASNTAQGGTVLVVLACLGVALLVLTFILFRLGKLELWHRDGGSP